jgi:hypothetical protein
MNDQAKHAIQQALIMLAVAAVAVLIDQQFTILESLVGHDYAILWSGLIAALLTAVIRGLEGMLDQRRAARGRVIPSDVPYDFVKQQVIQTPQLGYVDARNNDIYLTPEAPAPTG